MFGWNKQMHSSNADIDKAERSPFVVGRPLGPGKNLAYQPFGTLVDQVLCSLRQTSFVAVVGPHRNGKSTLLSELRWQWMRDGGAWWALDLASPWWESSESNITEKEPEDLSEKLYAVILEGLDPERHLRERPCRLAIFHRQMVEVARQLAFPKIVALDHIDALPFDAASELLVGLRAIYQELAGTEAERQLRFLLVGATSLAQLSLGPTSPLFPLARIHRIPNLTADETESLLRHALEQADIDVEAEALQAAFELFGGDRELLQRAGSLLVEEREKYKRMPVTRASIELVAEDLLTMSLVPQTSWPLVSELRSILKRDHTVLDIAMSLRSGEKPKRRELTPDIGAVELSGFFILKSDVYCFRTPFHGLLFARLGDWLFADLLAFHRRWEEARKLYQTTKYRSSARRLRLNPDELFIALGTQLGDLDDPEDILKMLVEMLEWAFDYEDVSAMEVRGLNPTDFFFTAGSVELQSLPSAEVEKCIVRKQVRVQRIGGQRRWLVPLTLRSGSNGYVAWLVVLHEPAWPHGSHYLPPAPSSVLFAQELVGKQQQLREQRQLQEITHLINSMTVLEDVLAAVLEASFRLTGSQHGHLLMPTRLDRLCVVVQHPDSKERIKRSQGSNLDSADLGVCGYVFAKKKPIIIEVADAVEGETYRFLPWIPGTVSEAAVPILYGERALGVINVESHIAHFFHAGHIHVLEQLAQLAAIAIVKAQLLKYEKEAMLSRIFGGIAHEVKGHASNAASNAGVLLSSFEKGWDLSREDTQRALHHILEETRATSQVVNDFYWLAGSRDELFESEKVGKIVGGGIALAGKKLRSPALDYLKMEDSGAGEIILRCRPNLLRRAIANLVVNAVEAVRATGKEEPGEGDVTIHLDRQETGTASITIRDRGEGLPEKEDIFAPYHTSKAGKGLGLGLSIAKTVVEAHKGTIEAHRRAGGGATIRIALPGVVESEKTQGDSAP